jgi:hypothetical protein
MIALFCNDVALFCNDVALYPAMVSRTESLEAGLNDVDVVPHAVLERPRHMGCCPY